MLGEKDYGRGDWMSRRNLVVGLGFFILALAIGALLMYRATHSGHMGIGLVRSFKLTVLMLASLAAAIYNFKQV